MQLGAKTAYTYRTRPMVSRSLAIPADVTDIAAMAVATEQGAIYGVVVNAGIGTNLKGIYNMLMPVVPKMYERGEGSID